MHLSALRRETMRVLHSESCREQCSAPLGHPWATALEGRGRGTAQEKYLAELEDIRTSGWVLTQSNVWGLSSACQLLSSGTLLHLKCKLEQAQDTVRQRAN